MLTGPTLTIDLAALTRNYQRLQQELKGAECAAVVKANGYGLGAVPVAQALAKAGCSHFFVATLEEALQLRAALPGVTIYVFHGLRSGEEKTFTHHRLIPVLNTPEHIALWAKTGGAAALQLDTGMSRLGLAESEIRNLTPERFAQAGISLVLSHLACADAPEHAENAQQLQRFHHLTSLLPSAKRSLANSAGIFLGEGFHFDLARPGCALYGINPTPYANNPMEPVATLSAPVLQLRTLEEDAIVGYDATCSRSKGTRIATVEIGYADGFFRYLSNKGVGFINGMQAPIIGRISMDMLMLDISHLPEGAVTPSTPVEFIGRQCDVNTFAAAAGTIGYEAFTRLGRRVQRVYI